MDPPIEPMRRPRSRRAARIRSRRSASATDPFDRRSSGPRAKGASPRARIAPGRSSSPGRGGRSTGCVTGGQVAAEDDRPEPARRERRGDILQAEEVLSPVEVAVGEEAAPPLGTAREGVEEGELVRVDGHDLDGRHGERPQRGGAAQPRGARDGSGRLAAALARRERGSRCDRREREHEESVPHADVVGRSRREEPGTGGERRREERRSGVPRAP